MKTKIKIRRGYEAGDDGSVNCIEIVERETLPPILLVKTEYYDKEKAPVDKKTGKRIKEKIEWQDMSVMEYDFDKGLLRKKCLWSKVIETW
nr:MAG TPA: hypothetical protein [Caudoviricetes sp.]